MALKSSSSETQIAEEGAAAVEALMKKKKDGPDDDNQHLTTAIRSLFANIATLVQSQLQGNTETLELLERMNLRTADEYNEFGDFAAGLRVFVERLKLKNDGFQQYSQQIDAIEQEVTELEAVISMLDKHTSSLEAKLRKAYSERRMP